MKAFAGEMVQQKAIDITIVQPTDEWGWLAVAIPASITAIIGPLLIWWLKNRSRSSHRS
jgi:hypothetical protein